MTQQVETVRTTYRTIMKSKHFNLGFADVVSNKGWNTLYDSWDINTQWCYERGRLFAIHTNGKVPVKKERKVSSDAIYAYVDGSVKKAII